MSKIKFECVYIIIIDYKNTLVFIINDNNITREENIILYRHNTYTKLRTVFGCKLRIMKLQGQIVYLYTQEQQYKYYYYYTCLIVVWKYFGK